MSTSGSQNNLQLWSSTNPGFEDDEQKLQESGSKRQALLRQSGSILGNTVVDHFSTNNPLYVSKDRVVPNPNESTNTSSGVTGTLEGDDDKNNMQWETERGKQTDGQIVEEISDNDSLQSYETIFYSSDDEEAAPICFDLYDADFNDQGSLIITKKRVQFDESHQSVNFPICNGIDTCNDPQHLKSGVLTPTHNRDNTEDCKLYNHILTLLCTTANSKQEFSCIKCPEATNQPFNEIKLHIRNFHGIELGLFLNKAIINKSIHRLYQNRVSKDQDWEIDPIPLVCFHCGVKGLDRFDLFLHVTLEHGVTCEKDYCPDCFAPILSGNLVGHVNDTHEASCNLCNKSFRSFNSLISHCLRKHFFFFMSNLSEEVRILILSSSKQNTIFTPYYNAVPAIYYNYVENDLMPPLFSSEFLSLINNFSPNDSAITKILLPFSQAEVIRENIRSTWPTSKFSNALLKDLNFQENINDFLTGNLKQLMYEHVDIYEKEQSLIPIMGCNDCLDDLSHEDSKERCSDFFKSSSKLYRLENYEMNVSKFKSSPLVLIGGDTLNNGCYKNKYPCLNLSETSSSNLYPNGYSNGIPIILGQEEPFNDQFKFKNYMDYIGRVTSLPPQSNHNFFVVEFSPINPKSSRLQILMDALCFIEGIQKIKERNKCTIVVMPKLRKGVTNNVKTDHLINYTTHMEISYIISLVCAKFFIPVLPLFGEITAVSFHNLLHGPWSFLPEHQDEFLFNSNGTTSREFRIRLGRLFDQLNMAWGRTIETTPHLKVKYMHNIQRGHFEYPQEVCSLAVKDENLVTTSENANYDTVG
jgi:hypothetical protein